MRILTHADVPPLSQLPKPEPLEMRAAGHCVLDCERVLSDGGANTVTEMLSESGEFYQWDHYPKGDIYCTDSHAQYYYHAHPPEVRDNTWGDEHGHYHTFLRPPGFPLDLAHHAIVTEKPVHLVAVSMGFDGRAGKLFTTNRWVTDEAWFDAGTVSRLLDHFHIGHETPSRLANVWLNNLLILFRPTIRTLLHARDEVLAKHAPVSVDTHVFEDRNLEVTSIIDIDVTQQLAAIEDALLA